MFIGNQQIITLNNTMCKKKDNVMMEFALNGISNNLFNLYIVHS